MGVSKRFNCSLCSFTSVSLDVMEQHQLLHPEGVAFIQRTKRVLIKQHTAEDEESLSVTPSYVELKCDVCPFKTTVYQRMWNHKQKHKKSAKFVCSKCTFSTGSEMCLEEHMIVHSEPNSAMDTGSVPSRSQSADGIRKSGSDETTTPDSQKASTLDDSGASTEGALNSSTEVEVKPPCLDPQAPLSIKVEPSVVSLMRPTKEVLPVLKRDHQNEDRRQCPDCPFVESDELIFNLHREMHGGRTRAFACNLCNYRFVTLYSFSQN
ncbi:zinc finger, C2H2 type, partial [Ostertagia ostertagi]